MSQPTNKLKNVTMITLDSWLSQMGEEVDEKEEVLCTVLNVHNPSLHEPRAEEKAVEDESLNKDVDEDVLHMKKKARSVCFLVVVLACSFFLGAGSRLESYKASLVLKLYTIDTKASDTDGGVLMNAAVEGESSNSEDKSMLTPIANTSTTPLPRFILGFSTGHTGSTSAQVMLKTGCPWNDKNISKKHDGGGSLLQFFSEAFELSPRPLRESYFHGNLDAKDDSLSCQYTRDILLPFLLDNIHKSIQPQLQDIEMYKEEALSMTTFVDMGHFNNRGKALECLHKELATHTQSPNGPLTWIRIRRNRQSVAYSFAGESITPCLVDHNSTPTNTEIYRELIPMKNKAHPHPVVATCPRSGEGTAAVALKVPNDQIWDSMTTFQQFLWSADEIEARWHAMVKQYNNSSDSANTVSLFLEMTWSSKEDFQQSSDEIRSQLGCIPWNAPNSKKHVSKVQNSVNCTFLVEQDFEYRQMMQFDAETYKMLYENEDWTLPDHMADSGMCMEDREELDAVAEAMKKEVKLWLK